MHHSGRRNYKRRPCVCYSLTCASASIEHESSGVGKRMIRNASRARNSAVLHRKSRMREYPAAFEAPACPQPVRVVRAVGVVNRVRSAEMAAFEIHRRSEAQAAGWPHPKVGARVAGAPHGIEPLPVGEVEVVAHRRREDEGRTVQVAAVVDCRRAPRNGREA